MQILFNKKCSACHEGGQVLSPLGNNLSSKALEKNGYAARPELVALIGNGKGMMPAFGASAPPYARFDEAQLGDVADYVLGQAAKGWK